MRTTPNDPATCWHEDLETDVVERRLDDRQLVRVDVDIVCRDCDTRLQSEVHTLPDGAHKCDA